jgi:Domain of unknown function (DUF1707)
VKTGPGGEIRAVAGHGHLRASHADRDHVIDVLKAAFVQGRLTKDELDERVGGTLTSRTYAELAALTADIPAGPGGATPLRSAVPPHRAAAALPQAPVTNVLTRGACVIVAAGLLVGIFSIFALGFDPLGLAVAVLALLVGVPIAGSNMYDSWRLKRSREQLPPPERRGQVTERGGAGSAVI